MAFKTIVYKMRNQNTIVLKIIANNWVLTVAKQIKTKVHGILYLRQIASVFVLDKDRYGKARQKLNFWIILYILLKKIKKSGRCYVFIID